MDDPTIPSNDRFVQYTYAGGGVVFQYDFPVSAASEVAVYRNDHQQNFPIDYTVTINPTFDGGTVTLRNTPDNGDLITIVGKTPILRTEYYGNKSVVSPTALDAECIKTIMRLQQLNTKILGCLKNQITETELDNTILPPTEDRKGKLAAWDQNTGALTFFGNHGIEEIYLKREKNLSDLVDTEKARENLHIINGREIQNNNRKIEYRKILDFDKSFKVLNDINKTVISLALSVINLGTGIPLVTKFSGNTIWARTLRTIGKVSATITSDGSILLADEGASRGFVYKFEEAQWGESKRITISSDLHQVANDDNILVSVRDEMGYTVTCNIKVDEHGNVSLFSNFPFTGTALIYGGMYPTVPSGLIINPMRKIGDLIFSSNEQGIPDRLPIGTVDQALVVGTNGLPTYKNLGTAAWKELNIPGGVPLLDSNNQIPALFLPFFTMTYRGTFGSPESSTAGDLPISNILDGDIYVCDTDYFSTVAEKSFLAGQWAIFNGTDWDIIPLPKQPDSLPIGSVISYAGSTIPKNYLPCNGYTLDRVTYSQLFSSIGTTYNSGQEQQHQFSIPNYNNEKRFLQAATVAGKKYDAGLPNITGSIPFDTWGAGKVSGAFYEAGNSSGASGGSDNNRFANFDASRSSAVYGRSDTVQPPAQDIVYLIKFQ